MGTKIGWTDETWNPAVGCRKVSEGCRHCYAEDMAARLAGMGRKWLADGPWEDDVPVPGQVDYVGTVDGRGRWTGRVVYRENRLWVPVGWRKPRRVFVCSMGDLFHEDVQVRWLDAVWAVMAMCPAHTFQVLTKRPGRMTEYLNDQSVERRVAVRMEQLRRRWRAEKKQLPKTMPWRLRWPLKNVWVGTTAENQAAADVRVPELVRCPAVVRFVSVEPMLGAVDLGRWTGAGGCSLHGTIDWVICGGESGPGARPVQADWVRDLRDGCAGAGVPFFFKQWGSAAPLLEAGDRCGYDAEKSKGSNVLDGQRWEQWPGTVACAVCGGDVDVDEVRLGMCPECFLNGELVPCKKCGGQGCVCSLGVGEAERWTCHCTTCNWGVSDDGALDYYLETERAAVRVWNEANGGKTGA